MSRLRLITMVTAFRLPDRSLISALMATSPAPVWSRIVSSAHETRPLTGTGSGWPSTPSSNSITRWPEAAAPAPPAIAWSPVWEDGDAASLGRRSVILRLKSPLVAVALCSKSAGRSRSTHAAPATAAITLTKARPITRPRNRPRSRLRRCARRGRPSSSSSISLAGAGLDWEELDWEELDWEELDFKGLAGKTKDNSPCLSSGTRAASSENTISVETGTDAPALSASCGSLTGKTGPTKPSSTAPPERAN